MNKVKVLNLYAGIGGNRRLWENVEVTAVEHNPHIAEIYGIRFPNDKVIIGDAHEYLLKHFREYDFIWSSPPCPTHSCIRKIGCNIRSNGTRQNEPVYPDMALYQEIILLQGYANNEKTKWVVENVMPYYEPLIKGIKLDRHYFWSNFPIIEKKFNIKKRHHMNNTEFAKALDFDLRDYYLPDDVDRRQIYRNCVDSALGEYLLNLAYFKPQKELTL